MSFGFLDIDHLIIRVARLADAVETFRSLGFQIAPERQRPAEPPAADEPPRRPPFATRQILFQPYPGRTDIPNFVVLQCIEDQLAIPSRLVAPMSFMFDTIGPKAFICFSPDLENTRAAMEAAGIEVAPAQWTIEQGWRDEELGIELPVQSQPCIALTRRTPFLVNGFTTSTVETYRHPPWTKHPNTARYMAGVTGVCDDLPATVEAMAGPVFGVEPEWISDDIAVVRPRDLFLRMVTPRGFDELYPGLDFSDERILPALVGVTFAVESIDTARAVLGAAEVACVGTPAGSLAVPRQFASNTLIELAPA